MLVDNLTVRAVFRVTLPHDGYGEIRAGHILSGNPLPISPRSAVVLDVGAGYWCRRSELERMAHALADCGLVSITGTELRTGANHGDVVSGLEAIAEELAQLRAEPALFEPSAAMSA
ncbi:hypothetical protein GA0115240_105822 [Streptomyces sp. DvalAA-14]|uniref:hypothetical protein n=1 Tax=unclassified Streptomyces TaxID=2593676 RepID=UPI00081B8500|nr:MULTISPECIES: hypothetical protein [unclassified Streptomyces]MYS19169.1 hypothetical protein [Streptomyces sp. SID4948]SCD38263.1 hypothetical protein GA0115240_105822 [Streptomyces sp. DvalAA-14]